MSRNYDVLHYIRDQVNRYYSDDKLYNVLARCFQRIENYKEPDGCLSNSVAIYICLKEFGYEPQLCYGLCDIEDFLFYHAWIELDNLVIDLSIYGNINYNHYFPLERKTTYPIVLEKYSDCYINYRKFCFDDDWKQAQISLAEDKSIISYINQAPNRGMYTLISKIMGEPPMSKIQQIVRKYGAVCIIDFRKEFEGADPLA